MRRRRGAVIGAGVGEAPGGRRARPWRRRVVRSAGALGLLAGVVVAGIAFAWVRHPFPEWRLEQWDRTRVVTAADGTPLLSLVGHDEQWRSPVPLEEVSPWMVAATIAVEDRRFRSHLGVDPVAVGRAAWQNLTEGRVVSGASTLTMQVCRMMDDRPRTLRAKIIESFRALQLERRRDKNAILELYLDVAPYGSNIRGAGAAASAWFGKPVGRLSLAEAALLAGLPQSPERLRPDRNPEAARARRATVLQAMVAAGAITDAERAAADAEPVVLASARTGAPGRATNGVGPSTSHAAWMAFARRPGGGRTTIDAELQRRVEDAVAAHHRTLPAGSDIAVVVLDVVDSSIVALVGSADASDPADGQVNGVLARRSPGSALKPFLYAAAIDAGRLVPSSLLPDQPIDRAGWRPENFDRRFRGPVSMAEALQSSLNVPAILVTEEIGVSRCLGVMEACGIEAPDGAAVRGGLSLAVGGIEVTLLDLTSGFATLARGGVARPPRLMADEPQGPGLQALAPSTAAVLSDTLSTRHRRAGNDHAGDGGWFAWKTGTSSARRDAVAVGHNSRYAVGVWVGRFAGGGDALYAGRTSAEPLLARLFADARLRVPMHAAPPIPDEPVVSRPLAVSAAAERQLVATRGGDADAASRPEMVVRIQSPRDGTRFVAWAGPVPVTLEARRVDPRTGIAESPAAVGGWLLDGRPLPHDARHARLPPGRYELTFVDEGRRTDTVRITVVERSAG